MGSPPRLPGRGLATPATSECFERTSALDRLHAAAPSAKSPPSSASFAPPSTATWASRPRRRCAPGCVRVVGWGLRQRRHRRQTGTARRPSRSSHRAVSVVAPCVRCRLVLAYRARATRREAAKRLLGAARSEPVTARPPGAALRGQREGGGGGRRRRWVWRPARPGRSNSSVGRCRRRRRRHVGGR